MLKKILLGVAITGVGVYAYGCMYITQKITSFRQDVCQETVPIYSLESLFNLVSLNEPISLVQTVSNNDVVLLDTTNSKTNTLQHKILEPPTVRPH